MSIVQCRKGTFLSRGESLERRWKRPGSNVGIKDGGDSYEIGGAAGKK